MRKLSPPPQCLSIKILETGRVVSAPYLGLYRHIPLYSCPIDSELRWQYRTDVLVTPHELYDQESGGEIPSAEWFLVACGDHPFIPYSNTDKRCVVGILSRQITLDIRLSRLCERLLGWFGR